jgi:hypothetical protein
LARERALSCAGDGVAEAFHGRQQVFVWLVIVMSDLYLPDTRFVPQNRVPFCVTDH